VWPVEKLAWGTTSWVETIAEGLGGNGANTSFALAQLTVPVKLMGVLGSDANAARAAEMLERAGVDISGVRRTDLPTPTSICVVHPTGDRLFLHRPGASAALEPADLHFDAPGFTHFHFANPFALPKLRLEAGALMARAKAAGLTTSLDTGWDSRARWIQDIGPCLPATDLLFVNESEAHKLTDIEEMEGAAAKLRRLGAGAVIVKVGSSGCMLLADSGFVAVAGFQVRVLDTTGAGDCFAGGFLAALHRGFDYAAAARFANAVGALNVEKIGAAEGVLSFDETERWMADRSTLGTS
jgi:sugar/nucleoside kinase (ribokinase family)